MNATKDVITQLIAEMDEIEDIAKSFQSSGPRYAKAPPEEQVTKLREAYLDWYARCLAILNELGKQTFQFQYSGASVNIHQYLADPGGTYRTYSGHDVYSWRHDFDHHFKRPFNEQRLLLMQIRATARARHSASPPPPTIDTIQLHSRVRAVSTQLFKDRHYRQSILQACLTLNEAVQQRSGRNDLDGSALMQRVFSKNDPILTFDGDSDEQLGYMWLFAGTMMAIRNPRAHKVGETEDLDANEALELLALVSALLRALDGATKT
jgi:uncharacterized protein (TIGR02391 family)